jgi:magnesium transporter
VRARIRFSTGRIRKAGPDYLAYALLDSIVDRYYPVLESIGSAIEEIEDEQVESSMKQSVRSLHQYKRTLTQIRRYVWPTRDVMSSLLHEETGFVRPETRVFLRECYDHTVQLMDLVDSYRDVLFGLMETYLSSVSIRTNEIMRVLTVISSVFIPLTFIASVHGIRDLSKFSICSD